MPGAERSSVGRRGRWIGGRLPRGDHAPCASPALNEHQRHSEEDEEENEDDDCSHGGPLPEAGPREPVDRFFLLVREIVVLGSLSASFRIGVRHRAVLACLITGTVDLVLHVLQLALIRFFVGPGHGAEIPGIGRREPLPYGRGALRILLD